MVLTTGLCTTLHSQENNHEIGIRVSDFRSLGAVFKAKDQNGKFQRVRIAAGTVDYRANLNNPSAIRMLGSLACGIEKRKPVRDQLDFIHGFEPFLTMNATISDILYVNSSFGLGYVIGLQYDLGQNLSLSLKTILSISTNVNFNIPYQANATLGGSSDLDALSVVHRYNYTRAKNKK